MLIVGTSPGWMSGSGLPCRFAASFCMPTGAWVRCLGNSEASRIWDGTGSGARNFSPSTGFADPLEAAAFASASPASPASISAIIDCSAGAPLAERSTMPASVSVPRRGPDPASNVASFMSVSLIAFNGPPAQSRKMATGRHQPAEAWAILTGKH